MRLRGAAVAAGEIRGLAGEMNTLAASQKRVAASSAESAAASGRLSGAMGVVGRVAKVGALAVAAIGFEATKAAVNFNHEMLRIRTDAGASTAELRNMKAGVLDLAASGASMGQGPMSLAQGLYHLESLGIRGAKALFALKLASQESAISGANLEQTTSALGAAMYTGIKGTGNLTQLMGTLNATVGAGNMRFQDLVDALGTGILPSAKVAGLSLQDVSAALAVLTDSGMNASSGAAQLATALHFLYAPTNKAQDALKSIGLSSTALAQDMHKPQGLLVALRDLRDHLSGLSKVQQAQVLSAILPGGRGRVLLTELTMLDRLQGKYKQINQTAAGFGGSVAMQRHDPQTQLRTAEAQMQAQLIRLGNVLQPIVVPALTAVVRAGTQLLGWLAKVPAAVQAVVRWFSSLTGGSSKAGSALRSIGNTASTLWHTLTRAFSGIASTARQVFSGSFVRDLGNIGRHLVQFGALVMRLLGPALRGVIRGFGQIVRGTFNVIAGLVHIVSGLLSGNFSKAWRGVKQVIGGVIGVLLGGLRTAFSAVVLPIFGAFKAAAGAVVSVLQTLWHNVLQPVASFLSGVFSPAVSVVKGIFDAFAGAANVLKDALQFVWDKMKAIGDWVANTGQSVLSFAQSLFGLSQSAGSLPNLAPGASTGLPGVAGTVPGAGPTGPNAGAVGSPPIITGNIRRHVRTAAALSGGGVTIHANIETPVIIDGREIARAHRRQVIRAMAAGA